MQHSGFCQFDGPKLSFIPVAYGNDSLKVLESSLLLSFSLICGFLPLASSFPFRKLSEFSQALFSERELRRCSNVLKVHDPILMRNFVRIPP